MKRLIALILVMVLVASTFSTLAFAKTASKIGRYNGKRYKVFVTANVRDIESRIVLSDKNANEQFTIKSNIYYYHYTKPQAVKCEYAPHSSTGNYSIQVWGVSAFYTITHCFSEYYINGKIVNHCDAVPY